MASDHTPTRPSLEPTTVDALRATFTRSLADGNHSEKLKDVLCAAAMEARAKGILAERLLIMLKDIWYSLPNVAGARSSVAENTLLQELISR